MFSIALFEPEIPPNTGNIIRLCANTGCKLHLIGKLGFELDDRQLRRAGLDYDEYSEVLTWDDWADFIFSVQGRVVSFSTKHNILYTEFQYQADDVLLFGPETRGLPRWLREETDLNSRLTVPMAGESRSLNLSNSVAIVVYEAWRQQGFRGSKN